MIEKYFIGIELPKKLNLIVDMYRREYYPFGLKNVPPHITIAGPFCLPAKEKMPSKDLERIVNSLGRFEVRVENFGTFQHDSAVYYLRILDEPILFELHLAVVKLLESLNIYTYPANRIYTPHITLANRLNSNELLQIQNQTSHLSFVEKFVVEHVALFYKADEKPYEVVARYSLDKLKDLRYHPEADLGNEWSPVKTSHP